MLFHVVSYMCSLHTISINCRSFQNDVTIRQPIQCDTNIYDYNYYTIYIPLLGGCYDCCSTIMSCTTSSKQCNIFLPVQYHVSQCNIVCNRNNANNTHISEC